jgi:hypothetical protein
MGEANDFGFKQCLYKGFSQKNILQKVFFLIVFSKESAKTISSFESYSAWEIYDQTLHRAVKTYSF